MPSFRRIPAPGSAGIFYLSFVLILTSVPEARFRHLGRKFPPLHSHRLPSREPIFGIWDGSFSPHTLADFRIRGPFPAFGTEVFTPWVFANFRIRSPFSAIGTAVLFTMLLQTSVSGARFRQLGRKFFPYAFANFRIRGLFSAVGTEV